MSYFFDDIKPYDNKNMSSSEDDYQKTTSNKKASRFDQYSSEEDGEALEEEEVLPIRDYEAQDEELDSDLPEEEDTSIKALKKTSFKKLKNLQDEFDRDTRKQNTKKVTKPKANDETLENIKQQLLRHKKSLLKLKKNAEKPKYEIPAKFDGADSGSDIGEGGLFEEEDGFSDEDAPTEQKYKKSNDGKKKQLKHAPKEERLSKKITFIRNIPGLDDYDRKESAENKQNDVRFDKALGDNNADYFKIRGNYKFLDEYREQEIQRMRKLMKDKKQLAKLEEHQIEELQRNLQKLENKMYTLRQKDKEHEFVKNYEKDINLKNSNRTSGNKFYLKASDKKKLLNKFKFENMDSSQRNKVMERKRKRQLGKEMKMFGQ